MIKFDFAVYFVFLIHFIDALTSNLINEVSATMAITLPLGSSCDFTSQCVSGAYCGDGRCRKSTCHQSYECAKVQISVFNIIKL